MVLAPKRHISAFSLLETMIAVAFFAIAFVFLMDAYNRGIFADLYLDRAATAVNLAQERMEQLKRGSYASITVGTGTENPVAGFTLPLFRRITQVTQTTGINSNYKTITITVSSQMKGRWEDYILTTYIADY